MDVADRRRDTPLIASIRLGDAKLVEYLLVDAKANPTLACDAKPNVRATHEHEPLPPPKSHQNILHVLMTCVLCVGILVQRFKYPIAVPLNVISCWCIELLLEVGPLPGTACIELVLASSILCPYSCVLARVKARHFQVTFKLNTPIAFYRKLKVSGVGSVSGFRARWMTAKLIGFSSRATRGRTRELPRVAEGCRGLPRVAGSC